MFSGWLTVAVFLPAATAVVLVFMPRRDAWIRWTAIGATVVELGLSIGIFSLIVGMLFLLQKASILPGIFA